MTTRVLLAKIGLDGHDRGVLIVARALRDAGLEVIYLGMRNTIDSVVSAAMQENPDVIGISVLSNIHRVIAPRLMTRMREAGLDDIPVIFGGTIAPGDVALLEDAGVTAVFPTGSSLEDIITFCRDARRGSPRGCPPAPVPHPEGSRWSAP